MALRTRLAGPLAVPFWLSGGCAALTLILISNQEPWAQGAPANADAGEVHVNSFKTPAERLGLTGKPRAKAEKCLADAIYFEARGEPMRGQKAVAQVVMNRVFSGRYPHDVCGVVFENASHYLACQFTFACQGRRLNHGSEPRMWQRANRIARDILDGKIWLKEVGHATHYHARWVRPLWIREMARLYRFGVHTFYRPRAWGDGSNAPILSNVSLETKPSVAGTPKSATAEPKTTGSIEPKPSGATESKFQGTTESKSTAGAEPKSPVTTESKPKDAESKPKDAESKQGDIGDSKSTGSTDGKANVVSERKSQSAAESKSTAGVDVKSPGTSESKPKHGRDSKSTGSFDGKAQSVVERKSSRAAESKSTASVEVKSPGPTKSRPKHGRDSKSTGRTNGKAKVAAERKSPDGAEPKAKGTAEPKPKVAAAPKS